MTITDLFWAKGTRRGRNCANETTSLGQSPERRPLWSAIAAQSLMIQVTDEARSSSLIREGCRRW
eukprot:12692659-Alexandrium_andersonii.AAC.1